MSLRSNDKAPDSTVETTHNVATPLNQRDDVIILPAVTEKEAKEKFPGWKSLTPYLRIVPPPHG